MIFQWTWSVVITSKTPLNLAALWSHKNWTCVFCTFNEKPCHVWCHFNCVCLRFRCKEINGDEEKEASSRFKWISMIQCKEVFDYHSYCMNVSCTPHFHKVWNLSRFFRTRLFFSSLLLFAVVLISVKTKCHHHHYGLMIISYFEYEVCAFLKPRYKWKSCIQIHMQTHSHDARTTFILTLWPNFVCLIRLMHFDFIGILTLSYTLPLTQFPVFFLNFQLTTFKLTTGPVLIFVSRLILSHLNDFWQKLTYWLSFPANWSMAVSLGGTLLDFRCSSQCEVSLLKCCLLAQSFACFKALKFLRLRKGISIEFLNIEDGNDDFG